MKQIPSQHCELESSSALPGWLVIPAKPLGNPLKQLNELLAGPQFHTRPIPLPPTAETPPHCRPITFSGLLGIWPHSRM